MSNIDWAIIILVIHCGVIALLFMHQFFIRRFKEPFEIINWLILSIFLFFIIRPAYLLTIRDKQIDSYFFMFAVLIGLLSTIVLLLGYYSKIGKIIAAKIIRIFKSKPIRDVNNKRLFLLFCIALFIYFIIIGRSIFSNLIAGKPLLLIGLARGQAAGTEASFFNSYYWNIIRYILFISYFFLYIQILLKRARRGWIFIFILITPFHLAAFLGGTRWHLLSQFIALIAIPIYLKRLRFSFWKMSLLIIFILFLFSALNIFRQTSNIEESFREAGLQDALFEHLPSFSFDYFIILLSALDSGQIDFLYGYPYIFLPLNIVPRAFWHTKPILSSTTLFTEAMWGTPGEFDSAGKLISAHTLTAPGELYWQFGILSVIIALFLWGVGAQAVTSYRNIQERRKNHYFHVFYIWFFLQSFNSFRDSLFSLIPCIMLFGVAWIVVNQICGRRLAIFGKDGGGNRSNSHWLNTGV